ncbi:MAG: hypothetical protein FJ336_08575, partial [Sphingomonadales bacterium]|nr:hypothetical protein [Sphingomonadales bacterium]
MSVRRVQLRRGTSAENNGFIGAIGEITVDTDRKSIRVHDGATAGGTETARVDLSNIDFNPDATVSFADSEGDSTVRLINVANPTNAQDVATKDYVDSAGASEIMLSELGDTFIVDPADAQILIYDDDAGANDDKWKNVTLSGDVTITNTGVVTLTTDSVDTTNIKNANVTNAKLANPSVTITDGTTSDTLALGQTLTLSNVANETTVVVSADVGAGVSVTIGLPDNVTIANDLTVNRDLGVTRNLTVTGNLVV